MPIMEKELPTLYIQQPDGTKTVLGHVQESTLDIIPDTDIDLSGDRIIIPERTATFEVRWNPTVDLMHLLIYGRIPTNNWRKLHGFPLKRHKK